MWVSREVFGITRGCLYVSWAKLEREPSVLKIVQSNGPNGV